MRVVLEGSEEQIEKLKSLIAVGDDSLPTIREDYQTENLWCVEDVQGKFKCTDAEALDVLESALTNEATMEQIWFAINFEAEFRELERVNDDDDEY